MVFPIYIQFNKPLKVIVTPDNLPQILQYIGKAITNDKADNVVVNDDHVAYKGSTSRGRGSLFGSVDGGVFTLLYINDRWFLNYPINMVKLFTITSIISTIMGSVAFASSAPWWIGLAFFCWLCGVNWIISVPRHEMVAGEIAVEIDEMICGKPPRIEHEKFPGKLKSWF